MPALILRVLTLVALALMPLGMGAAMALPMHDTPAAASAKHCDDHGQPAGETTRHSVDCIACSMMFTAQARVREPVPLVRLPSSRSLAVRRSGFHPETATPPPKLS